MNSNFLDWLIPTNKQAVSCFGHLLSLHVRGMTAI